MKASTKVIIYLQRIKEFILTLSSSGDLRIVGYADSDYLFKMTGEAISLKCKTP